MAADVKCVKSASIRTGAVQQTFHIYEYKSILTWWFAGTTMVEAIWFHVTSLYKLIFSWGASGLISVFVLNHRLHKNALMLVVIHSTFV